MSEVVYEHAAGLFDWLYHDARMAVQVFFVVGGFLAARTLAPDGVAAFSSPLALLWRRYCRLAIPYRDGDPAERRRCSRRASAGWSTNHVPGTPTLSQFLRTRLPAARHPRPRGALRRGMVCRDRFSAVRPDGRIALVRASSGAAGASRRWASPLSVSGCSRSPPCFYFNRDPDWDAWALYFFAAYALGALAYWASERTHSRALAGERWRHLRCYPSWWISGRVSSSRLAVALAIGARAPDGCCPSAGQPCRWLSFLGRISYSVFLVHFPVCMLINAAVFRFFQARSCRQPARPRHRMGCQHRRGLAAVSPGRESN